MKTSKLFSIGLIVIVTIAACQQAFGQLADFYTSPGYSTYINDLITNHRWNSAMRNYTKNYKGSSTASRSRSSAPASPPEVPAYRRYPAVQFKSTGTRLTVQEYLDSVSVSPQEKRELKELVLAILKVYEAEAAAKGYPNDWALAFVSYVGLNSHVYHGKTGKLSLPFEQNLGLRDVVGEHATDHGIFNNVTDRQKQELYELLVLTGGLTYHFYEKAVKEKNAEGLRAFKLQAAQNLRLVGIKP